MTRFLDELVFTMPSMSMAAIEDLGEALLTALSPDSLKQPTQLNVLCLVENILPQVGIHVYPARAEELGEREGATDPGGTGEINILITEDLWHDLYAGGRQSRRSRATILHEVSHAVLHVPVVRRRLASPHHDLLLARVRRESIPAYMDPEWQAWAFGRICAHAPPYRQDAARSFSLDLSGDVRC